MGHTTKPFLALKYGSSYVQNRQERPLFHVYESSYEDELLVATPGAVNGFVAQGMVEAVHSDGSTVKIASKPEAFVSSEVEFDLYAKRFAEAKMKGYEADPYSECDSFTLVRNGSCLKCDSCGTTTGCS